MSSCPACLAAAKRVAHEFHHGCRGCAARALARGPHFHRVRAAGALDRHYRAALQQFGLSHAEVKAAADVDVLSKRESKA